MDCNEMNRKRKASIVRSQNAVSIALGIYLLLSVALVMTALYVPLQVPFATRVCEFNHANEVLADFIVLNSSIRDLTHAQSAGASTSVPIQMAPQKESSFSLTLASGSMNFSPNFGTITVKLNEAGTGNSGIWTDEDFTATTSSNVKVSSDNVTLLGPPYSRGNIESNFTALTGQIGKDLGNDNIAYDTFSWYTQLPFNTEITMKVRSDMSPNMTHAKEWYECPAIASQDGANTIPLSDLSSVSDGHRYIQYRAEFKTWNPLLTPTLLNTSVRFSSPTEGVVLTNSSGALTFASNYYYLPDHVLTYENGIVLKSQEEGGFVVSNSVFSFNKTNASTSMKISIINLTGSPASLVGGPMNAIRLFRSDYELISDSLFYPNLTLAITTDYPAIWITWLNQTLEDSALTPSYDYTLTSPANNLVIVNFYGHDDGVCLYLEKNTVLVDMRE
jgi:hypothetical protein